MVGDLRPDFKSSKKQDKSDILETFSSLGRCAINLDGLNTYPLHILPAVPENHGTMTQPPTVTIWIYLIELSWTEAWC